MDVDPPTFAPGARVTVTGTSGFAQQFHGRSGRLSHLVAGEAGGGSGDELWVVAVARSQHERRRINANPYGNHPEASCSWVPVARSQLTVADEPPESHVTWDLDAVAQAAIRDAGESPHKRPRLGSDPATGAAPAAPAALAAPVAPVAPAVAAAAAEGLAADAPMTAVIVCFRDLHPEQNRGAHLAQFIPHLERVLGKSGHRFRVFVIEQSNDGRKFNRGKLLNIGFEIAKQAGASVFVFHDVDLLPSDELVKHYVTQPADNRPVHIAGVWDRYQAKDYVGGIVAWSRAGYQEINGFPNNYWGWGGEDDEMMSRCKALWGRDFAMAVPTEGHVTDLEAMDMQQKLDFLRQHRDWKCNFKWEVRKTHQATWRTNGLSNLRCRVLAQHPLAENTVRVTVDVELNGGDPFDKYAPLDSDKLLEHMK